MPWWGWMGLFGSLVGVVAAILGSAIGVAVWAFNKAK